MKFLLSLLLLISFNLWGSEVKLPQLTSPVMDLANVVSPQEKQMLDQMIRVIYRQGGPQVTILTVKDLQDLTIEDFSIKVAEKWKLGTEKADNGLLIIASMTERRMRIEVGGGIEGDITDLESNLWIRNILTPAFKQNQYGQGFITVLSEVGKKYNIQFQNTHSPIRRQNQRPINIFPLIILIGGLSVIGMIFRKSPVKRGMVSSVLGGGFILLNGGTIILAIMFLFIFFGIGMIGVHNLLLLLASANAGHRGGGGFGGGGGGWGGGGGGFSGGGSSGSW